ncbi:N-acetyltransferase [Catellatospora sp. TT07R-123]|uniref:acetyltransferase n=1 Tax=Catellatospora sp. TT07R-123 TaxID=2733863 RepID=UPI001B047806|nr:acetyltransferase [Catellatospora sp. TT07R-123]GHJ48025.1 N-acetyltransferase [Catellatospora sp. TT07R-123]
MTDLVIRPLVAGEEHVFDAMPDPLPGLPQVGYADGLAGGGYRPEHTWVALRGGRTVARAAWLLPPGAVGRPWLERFDLVAEPQVGAELLHAAHAALGGPGQYYATGPAHWRDDPQAYAAVAAAMAAARLAGLAERGERLRYAWTADPAQVSAGGLRPAGTDEPVPEPTGRFRFRPAADAAEIGALVARISDPDVLTGAEVARLVCGVDLARDPLAWLSGPPESWRVAEADGEPVGLAGPAGDACYPMIAYLGVLDGAVRAELLADAVAVLAAGGALSVVADVDADRSAARADLLRTAFTPVRSRTLFTPA